MSLMADEEVSQAVQTPSGGKKEFPLTGTIFVSGVAGASILFGFGYAFGAAKKADPQPFAEGLTPPGQVFRDAMGRPIPNIAQNGAQAPMMMESGASLALRALGRGTLYAILGVSAISFGIWKLSGAKDMEDFRGKVQGVFPQVKRHNSSTGRSDFASFRELFEYLSTEQSRKKQKNPKTEDEE